MSEQNKQYILSLNEEQIKIVMWETKKYHTQLLEGGDVEDMPLPIFVVAQGYESVYNACREILSDKMIIGGITDSDEDTDKDTPETTEPETPEPTEPDTPTEETGGEDTGDEWVRPDEYKDSPLTDDEIKELLGWLGQ